MASSAESFTDVGTADNPGALESSKPTVGQTKQRGPMVGTIWWLLTLIIFTVTAAAGNYEVLYLVIGWRSVIALLGYLIMQVGLWHAEHKWDEEGSAAFLEAAGKDAGSTPEELEGTQMGEGVKIPADKLKSAFPIPWGFLVGWWVWGLSYLFPLDGTSAVAPTAFGIVALLVSFAVSFIASIPMSEAVMNRNPKKKKMLSLMFLIGWILLGIMSALDVTSQLKGNSIDQFSCWVLCILGPFTVILSQKILFMSRKMGTLWEQSGKPNFHPVSNVPAVGHICVKQCLIILWYNVVTWLCSVAMSGCVQHGWPPVRVGLVLLLDGNLKCAQQAVPS